MTNKFIRENELTQLRDELDAVAGIVDDACCNEPSDDLNWAVSIIAKAADFVAQSLERIKEGTSQ